MAPWAGTEGSGSKEGGCRGSITFECGETPLRKRKKQRNEERRSQKKGDIRLRKRGDLKEQVNILWAFLRGEVKLWGFLHSFLG